MSDTIVTQKRLGKEVLRLLANYSPLTIEMLEKMIEPTPRKKSLRKAVGVLRKRELVDMVVGNQKTFFYQLHQSRPNRAAVERKIGDGQNVTEHRLLRKQDWVHNEWCDFWTLIVKRAFPEVQIVREYDLDSHEIAKSILCHNGDDPDLVPDLLLIFPPQVDGQQKISIALEVERTRKTNARIQRKLKKYIYETHLDGLIYVCDSGRLSETIRQLYEQKTLERAHKKSGYIKNFFLFSDAMSAGPNPLATFYNADGQPASMHNWIPTLRLDKTTLRRDSKF